MAGLDLRTHEDIAHLRCAREAFLSDHTVDQGVPQRLSAAWRRALFLGVQPERETVPAVSVAPDSPLLAAATPVLGRLTGTLDGIDVSIVLSDAHAHILGCWACSQPTRVHLDRIQTRPGADLSEAVTGNNGISDVLESSRSVLVTGPEHIFGLYQHTVCAGAPVRDPVTRRVAGAVALVCDLDSPPALIGALADSAVMAIESELLNNASPRERVLVDAYLRAAAGSRAVAVLDGRTRIVSPAAAALLSEEDIRLLEARAADALGRRTTVDGHLDLATSSLAVRVCAVTHAGATCGIVVLLQPPTPGRPLDAQVRRAAPEAPASLPALPGLVGSSPVWRQTVQAAADLCQPTPAMLVGEPGTGKTALAVAIASTVWGRAPVAVVDAALAGEGGPGFLRRLRCALAAGGAVVLPHLEALPEHAASVVLALSETYPDTRIIATCAATGEHLPAVTRLRAHLAPARLVVPPLRDRAADIPALVHELSCRESAAAAALTLTLDARQTLQHYRWPGNVSELAGLVRQLLTAHGTARPVGLAGLPDHISRCARGRLLSGLESAEYAAIRDALQRHGGNRLRAAKSLGIARATLYRKLRQYGLDGTVPATGADPSDHGR